MVFIEHRWLSVLISHGNDNDEKRSNYQEGTWATGKESIKSLFSSDTI